MTNARPLVAAVAMLVVGIAVPGSARAQSSNFFFSGSGVSGMLTLSYGAATDSKYPNAYEITGISGNFTDTNNGLNLVNVPVGSLVPINPVPPADPLNVPAPHDFSTFAVAAGLAPQAGGVLTFDNLFWPGQSPVTCIGYPFFGGVLDTYGLLFNIGNGQVAGVWSNGDQGNGVDYGVAVATSATAQDYVMGGVMATTTPEPGALWLVGTGLVGVFAQLRRRVA